MQPDFHRDLMNRSLPREHGFERLRVEGTLPRDLSGTLYRNGPGVFELFGQRYGHPFDGDAVISALRLRDGQAWGAAKIVESEGLRRERAAGRILYGTAAPWWRRMLTTHIGPEKVTPNTSVMGWGGQLLALNEGGPPVALDPHDLSTLGVTNLGGVLRSAFSAHPHRIGSQRITYNIGLDYGATTHMHIYALPDAGAARHLGAIPFDEPPLVHDFAATEKHLIFFVSPARLRLSRHLWQVGHFGELFGWQPEKGTEIIVVPLAEPDRPVRFRVEPFFQWHFANAFERGGELVIDYVRFDDLSPLAAVSSPRPSDVFLDARCHRAVIDPARRTFRSQPLGDFGCEFPRVHPELEGRELDALWLTRGDLRSLIRLDPNSGHYVEHALPRGHYAAEPVFAPRHGATSELDGYMLCMIHDEASDCGHVAIYDAASFQNGPIARAWFDHYLTCTFHGTWLAS